MCYRYFPIAALAVVLTGVPVRADEVRDALVIKPAFQKLTVWELDRDSDNEQTYPVQFDAKIHSTPDNKDIALEDLKRDSIVRVTTQTRGDTTWITAIEVLPDTRTRLHDGLVVKAGDGELVMTDMNGKNLHAHPVPEDAKITLQGKDVPLTSVPKGSLVRVTTAPRGGKLMAVIIEVRDMRRR